MPGVLNVTGILSGVPTSLRDELISAYERILTNYAERRWEPSELNGGKLCEVVYSILQGHTAGSFPTKAKKPSNMVKACHDLEQAPSTFPRSVRIQIPRMLIALYEIRNNRGVGHVGADVDPNHMDALCVLQMSKWVFAELVRIFHGTTTEEAEATVDVIVERELQLVWKVGDKRRVLDPSANMKEKTLLLLYQSSKPVSEKELFDWAEHSNVSVYWRDVLRPLHKSKKVEFDQKTGVVTLSPLGTQEIERLVRERSESGRLSK